MKKLLLFLLFIFSFMSCEQPTDPAIEENPVIEDHESGSMSEPEYFEIFYDDIENGVKNWTAEVDWTISNRYSASLYNSWIERNGNYLADQDYSLISQVFDFTDYENIRLTFYHTYQFENNYDFGYVEWTIDGSTWNQAAEVTGENLQWHKIVIDIPAANEATAQVRFRVVTDSTVQLAGWFIDEIKIEGTEVIPE